MLGFSIPRSGARRTPADITRRVVQGSTTLNKQGTVYGDRRCHGRYALPETSICQRCRRASRYRSRLQGIGKSLFIVARTSLDDGVFASTLRPLVYDLNPTVPVWLETMDDLFESASPEKTV